MSYQVGAYDYEKWPPFWPDKKEWWQYDKPLRGALLAGGPAIAEVTWKGVTCQELTWKGATKLELEKVIQYRDKVRRNTPIKLTYTFRQTVTKAVIPLTLFTGGIFVELKRQEDPTHETIMAYALDPAAGVARRDKYIFMSVGVWDIQFFGVDDSGSRTYGEPLEINVVPNVDDLATTEIAQF